MTGLPRKPEWHWPEEWLYRAMYFTCASGGVVIYGRPAWPSCSEWLVPCAEPETRAPHP